MKTFAYITTEHGKKYLTLLELSKKKISNEEQFCEISELWVGQIYKVNQYTNVVRVK